MCPQRIPSYRPLGADMARKQSVADARRRYDRTSRDPELRAFYSSGRWTKLSKLKRELTPLCELCTAEGLVTPADMVHHTKPVRESMSDALVLELLQSLCNACHARTHAQRDGGGG